MLKNDRHARTENGSYHRVGQLHSIDVSLRKSHLHHIHHSNRPTSCPIRQGTLVVDIPNNGNVVSNALSGRVGSLDDVWSRADAGAGSESHFVLQLMAEGMGSLSQTAGVLSTLTNPRQREDELGEKSLGLVRRPEPSHLSFSLPGRLVRSLRTIVRIPLGVSELPAPLPDRLRCANLNCFTINAIDVNTLV